MGDKLTEKAIKNVGKFVKDEHKAVEVDNGRINPGDWIVLTTGDHKHVGNHPMIQVAFKEKFAGRVLGSELIFLSPSELAFLGPIAKGKGSVRQYAVQFFQNQDRSFIFMEFFIRKVKARPDSPIEIR